MKNLKFLALLIGVLTFTYSGCKKEEVKAPEKPKGLSVNYSVNVVSAANSINARTSGITAASVTLMQNGTKTTKSTDENGFATFNDLRAGDVAVSVSMGGFTSLSYVTNLNISDTLSDAVDFRYASTIVMLYPLSGNGTATISGLLKAEISERTGGKEPMPSKRVFISIDATKLVFSTHKGSGKITQAVVQDGTVIATTDGTGSYKATVPASAAGLPLIIQGEEFEALKVSQTGQTGNPPTPIYNDPGIRTLYSVLPQTLDAVSGNAYFADITY